MLEFVLNTIFWTLAFYGFFELVKNIIYITTYTKLKADGMHIIITVKNQEDKIEGVLRSILFKILYGKEEHIQNVIVADLQSQDKTKEIAKKIEKDYDIIKVVSWKECKDIIDGIDSN
ncbi:MAG: glycosyltransferase [Clostridia bacterium]|nr:glycosyltransferase [Clostridia bacterium]